MIEPFLGYEDQDGWKAQHGNKTISAGLTSYGYDARLAPDVKLVMDTRPGRRGDLDIDPAPAVIDPKNFNTDLLQPLQADPVTRAVVLPPHSFALAHTIERFSIPREVLVVCVGKSTYARCGLIVNVTPLEPEWQGQVTLEISNTTPVPALVYVGEGICQMLFHRSSDAYYRDELGMPRSIEYGTCRRSYADKRGRYQDQSGIVTPTADQSGQYVG